MLVFVPSVKRTDHVDRFRVGRPYGKEYTLFAVFFRQMRAELFVDLIMRSVAVPVSVVIRNEDAVLLFLVAAVFLDAILYSNPERICFAGNGSSPFALFPARVFCGAPAQNALRMTPATEEPSADLLLNNI